MTKKIIFVLSIACLLFSLNACKSKGGNANQTQITTGDNTKDCLDWKGRYSGVTPCADCDGIEVTIILKENNTYEITWYYLGKGGIFYGREGKFKWNSTDSIITLEDMEADTVPTMYKVCENHLLQLDLKGQVVTGEHADDYILNKVQE